MLFLATIEIERVKRDDVLQNANYTPTGSSPMAQETRPHGATPLLCVLAYRAAAWGGKVRKFSIAPVGSEATLHHFYYTGGHVVRCEDVW